MSSSNFDASEACLVHQINPTPTTAAIEETEDLLDLVYSEEHDDDDDDDEKNNEKFKMKNHEMIENEEEEEEEGEWSGSEKENSRRMCKSATFHDFCDDVEIENSLNLKRPVTTLHEEELEEDDEYEDAIEEKHVVEEEEEDDEDNSDIVIVEEEINPEELDENEIEKAPITNNRNDQKSQKDRRFKMRKSNTFASFLNMFVARKRAPISATTTSATNRNYVGARGEGERLMMTRSNCMLRPSVSLSVVQESMILGSDGESVEVSPCTSDQTPTGVPPRYIVNVKMRQKPTRKWSEEEIQKRLSLPADLRLPVAVVDKLNRTPTLDQPLTRKNRRASLSEIGFGKLETYEKLEKLGEGTYATVYRGRSLLSNKCVALKETRLEQEEGAPCTAIREVSLLRNLKHANVVTLHDIIHTDRLLTLVFEYVDRDLKQYMDACNNSMHMSNIKLFLYQLLRGLSYCHQRRVLHRDLKPQNLLITSKGELKLADFGLARAKSVPTKTYSNEVVTLWYRPPDVLLGSTDYSTHIDMWGVGCILFEMIAGRALFPGGTTDEQLGLIFRTLGSPRPDRNPTICERPAYYPFACRQYNPEPLCRQIPRIDAHGFELLMKFLQYEGRDRISATDALKHQFLRTIAIKCLHLRDEQSVLEADGIHIERETLCHEHNGSRRNHRAAAGKEKLYRMYSSHNT